MMDWTDRHCRYFHRLLSARAVLYSEMVTADAVIHGDRDRLIGFDATGHPVVLQLGGASPQKLAKAARIAAGFGYDAINLNVGCPSDRVQSGAFGAALMANPDLVGECVSAMQQAVDIPVTVKCRIGIDNQDSEEDLERFIARVSSAGCEMFIVHARKAWLKGLSPKQNRDVPPLDHDRVYRLKQRHPDLEIHINGGIESIEDSLRHLTHVDGVMLGRAAYQKPWLLAAVDEQIYNAAPPAASRIDVMRRYMAYMARQLDDGVPLGAMARHVLGLWHGQPGARQWRQIISQNAWRPGAGIAVIEDALAAVEKAGMKAEDFALAKRKIQA
ncbi:MAG TPA: tRNA dihydrouridine(20/20a) synthase DusA [Rhizobiales bacterium]|nr:tRNA dihydrouridine(20/20a) synthase DusA [Hyphomicrobiales bacterium]